MTDFVEALESELRRAARRRAGIRRPPVVPAAIAVAVVVAALLFVVVVPPAGDRHPSSTPAAPHRAPPAAPAATTPPPIPADVSPGARHSKRFGVGTRVAVSRGVPVYADIDRWRHCPLNPRRLTQADVPAAVAAVVATVPAIVARGRPRLDPTGARGIGTLVTHADYAIHQCGSLMRRRSVDVFVLLPKVTFSASLAQLDLVVARTRAGWVVFDRRH